MPGSLLAPDSQALRTRDEILARLPLTAQTPGLPQARLLADYVIGRRGGSLDVSGRTTDGTHVSPADAPARIIVVDDPHGLQARVLTEFAPVATFNDRLDEAGAVAAAAPSAEAVADLGEYVSARLAEVDAAHSSEADEEPEVWAVVNAPMATSALAEVVAVLQPLVSTLIVIGRSDVMSRAVNKELARGFGRVDVSPGIGKHRLIIGSRPLSTPSLTAFPRRGTIETTETGPLEVSAHGACFSGTKADEGSTLLLTALAEAVAAPDGPAALTRPASVLDLGVGNGWLLTAALRVTGAGTGVGVDISRAAVASAQETAEANGSDIATILADATDADALTGEFDLILLNPPFHHGTTIETDTAGELIRTAAAHLRPGGRVVTVFNSHLRYRDRLESLIGPSEQLARTAKFTVVISRAPD